MSGKPSILLIDDDGEDRFLIRSAVGDLFHVEEAGTIAEGLRMMAFGARGDGKGFDLVLLDLTLPDSEREQTLGRVLAEHPDKPPVIVTGYAEPNFVERMLALGARSYLIKGRDDADPELLRSRLQQLLNHANSTRQLGEATEIITRTKRELETDFVARGGSPHGPTT